MGTIVVLALPILLTAALQSVSSMIKLYWVGQVGRSAIASVAVSETIAFLLFPLLIGLSTGTAAIMARAVGAADHDAAALTAVQSILLAAGLGALSTFLGRSFSTSLLALIGADAAVLRGGHGYLDILLLGIVPLFLMFIATAALNAAGHTAQPMFASVAVSVFTLVLAPCMMFGRALFPRLGLEGAAWATVLGDIGGAALALGMLFRCPDFSFHSRQWRPDFHVISRILRIGTAGFGQLFLRMIAGAVMMRIVATGGTAVIIAYGIGLRLDAFVLTPSFALGGAAATVVGISLGARDPRRARSAAWSAALIDFAIILPIIALTIVFAPLIVGRFNQDPAVLKIASAYLHIVWPTHFFTAMAITFGRAMQGAGDTSSSMIVTIVGLWLLQIPLAAFLAARTAPQGLWWAIAAAAAVQGIAMVLTFERGQWRTKSV